MYVLASSLKDKLYSMKVLQVEGVGRKNNIEALRSRISDFLSVSLHLRCAMLLFLLLQSSKCLLHGRTRHFGMSD